MNQDELLETVKSLRAALASTEEIDDLTRQRLELLTADIESILERQPQSDDTEPGTEPAAETLSEKLRETLIEFEARHPQIAGILERLTDGLSNLGI